jgi:hypothetical protein
MKRLLSAVLLVVLLAISAQGSAETQAAEPAFRNLAWGDTVEEVERKAGPLIQLGGWVTAYRRAHENLALGPVQARFIHYTFFDDKLFEVAITFDKSFASAVQEICVEKYGEPLFDTETGSRWKTARTSAFMFPDPTGSGSYLLMLFDEVRSAELVAWYEEQKKEKSQEAW